MTVFARGLVVGKFCPLHRGHQLLIDEALARCGHTVVISYTEPGFEHCEAPERERWFAALYPDRSRLQVLVLDNPRLAQCCRQIGVPLRSLPHNDAAEEDHRQFCGWLLQHFGGGPVDAVFTSETYGDGFAASLSRQFPDRTAVQHVCVDLARERVPVSGRRLREDPLADGALLAPEVRASFVRRIAVLGGESSGKTTLARALADALQTRWVAEYGRELWEQVGSDLDYDRIQSIAPVQVQREYAQALRCRRWLVCDTTPLTTLFYSLHDFGRASDELLALSYRRYDLTVLCEPDFAFAQDGTRREAGFRDAHHHWALQTLAERGVEPLSVRGSVNARVEQVLQAL